MKHPVFKLFAIWCYAFALLSGLTYFVFTAFPNAGVIIGTVCAAALMLDLLWIGLLCCQNFMMLPDGERAILHASQGAATIVLAAAALVWSFHSLPRRPEWLLAVIAAAASIGLIQAVAGILDLHGYPFRLIPSIFALARCIMAATVFNYDPLLSVR